MWGVEFPSADGVEGGKDVLDVKTKDLRFESRPEPPESARPPRAPPARQQRVILPDASASAAGGSNSSDPDDGNNQIRGNRVVGGAGSGGCSRS